jgi:tetratricopeptide (TPR) repeat protein
LQIEMLTGARRHGAVATRIAPALEALLREIDAGHPVVVLQNLGLTWWPVWHYAVAIGYDLPAGDLLLRSGTTRREVLALSTFEHTWRRAGAWGFVALPPGQWPASASEKDIVEAAVGFERVAAAPAAVTVYRSALQRWPGNLALAIGLGNSLHASGNRAAAAAVFRAAAEAHRSAAAWVNLSTTLVELGRIDQALQAADAALATGDPKWREAADQARALALTAQTKLSSPRR